MTDLVNSWNMPLSASILSRLLHQHETIGELISGFSEQQLKHAPDPEKWSAFQNIVHLAAYQLTHIQRLNLILQADQPRFERYVAENDPVFYSCLKKSLPELLDYTNHHRSIIIDFMTGLGEDKFKLKGIHPKYGSLNLIQWTEFFLLHEAHHLWTILQLISTIRIVAQE
jgi:hypothetical protein